ncbi:hypothetical protein KP77_28570 [Jeotgalibacillus alimentarius]|uniref:Recombinase n=2 Tax=Jeotgalibacillus alimentarius TaxID=135826 RepID=A0A0C2R5P2_9BACL|nr:hypothetical protein KP77_28570 [Jeotgalibacillus alimentarius]
MDLELIRVFLESRNNGPVYVDDITTEDIEVYLKMLKDEKGYKASSRNRHLNSLRAFYKYVNKKGISTKNPTAPIDQVKVQKQERTYLTEEEINLLVKEIRHPIIKMIVQFLFMSGLRISECLSLKLSDVDLEKGVIYVKNGKGKKDRNVPISTKLNPLLTQYLKKVRPKTTSDHFFATKKTGKISAAYVNRVLQESVKTLGWNKRVTAHTMRHSFASQLVVRNVNPVSIQKLLGHSDLKTTSIYVHANAELLTEAINAI